MSRNLNLDVLRGLAVIVVMLGHHPIHWRFSHIAGTGVDLFFVISGFLVSGLIFKEFARTGGVRLLRFWARRAARIYPPFLALIAATVAIAPLLEPGRVTPRAVLAELTWTQNFWPGLWLQTWSLAVEEHFYLLLPIAMIPMASRIHQWPRVVVGACLVALALRSGCFLLGVERTPGGQYIQWFTPLRLDNLAIGTVLAYGWHCRRDVVERIAAHRIWLFGIVLAGTVPLALAWNSRQAYLMTAGTTVLGVSFAAACLLALTSAPWKMASPVAWVGRISYSLYLWHFSVSMWITPIALKLGIHLPRRSPAATAVYLAGSLLLGWIMARAVEDPAIRLRDRIFPQSPNAAAVSA